MDLKLWSCLSQPKVKESVAGKVMIRYCHNQNSNNCTVISEGPLSIGELELIGFDPLEKRGLLLLIEFSHCILPSLFKNRR